MKKWMLVLMSALLLMGCKEQPYTVDYFLEHPIALEAALEVCLNNSEMQDTLPRCKAAGEAQAAIKPYILDQQTDPERFGKRILESEMLLGRFKSEMNDARKLLDDLRAKQATDKAIARAEAQLTKAEIAYRQQSHEVAILLAVAALNSPE